MGNLTQFIGGQHYTDSAGAVDHLNIQVITQTAYAALDPSEIDPNTLYLITA